ncbi:MAG TPA: carboxyvinyl-carboxyphosphonate phosphorylmutase [Alphaproteobacteria bacterium]|nr:carboxyvinyl-carboxyphosphonate phosphorylmutase [Alphaproteobacteria bacterium]
MRFYDQLTSRRASFARRIADGPIVVAPGVYDLLSAKIADALGFAALYMTGYGINASLLGRPDAGLGTFRDFVERVRTLSEQTQTPLIADADTGFGGALNVQETVRGYERAGAAAIQIEDQVFPKRCGHTLGREVVPTADMVLKIRVACDTREDPNFLIIARTDARTTQGLDEALTRAKAYRDAGADILFVESPESADELAQIGRALKGTPLLANMVPGGRTPVQSAAELEAMGFRLVIHPGACLAPAAGAMRAALKHLQSHGDSRGAPGSAFSFTELHPIVGFDQVWAFDEKYRGTH